ncbi:MAG: hypothetical protein J6K42_02660 [Clostridia bacterium]|nr:hypothetical protein [Clostridia bacterium]
MIRLKIKSKKNNNYILKDEKNNIYNLNFEFFDIEKEPKENDYINISAELLNPQYKEYTTYFSFGSIENICGRKDVTLNDVDVIKIEIEDKEIYLKRLYG